MSDPTPTSADVETVLQAALRILVVDDSATVRATVTAQLIEAGHEVEEADDGDVALLKLHGFGPDVVLMDGNMPRLSGVEALQRMQATPSLKDIPVVMLTAQNAPEDKAAAFEAGAHDFLSKPFEPVELLARVRAAGRTGRALRELQTMNAELDRAANVDELTGLANRRRVRQVMGDQRTTALTIIMADIDHFKAVNDTYGHDVGDAVLSIVARRLRTALRDADIVGRWGGEEFLSLLSGADPTKTGEIGTRILDQVRRPLGLGQGPDRVTVSLGAAYRVDAEETVDSLLRRADLALYEAKAGGRDQLRVDAPERRAG